MQVVGRAHGREIHLGKRTGWLRAAVLGADDGIVSTASLVIGVAASDASTTAVVTAGLAGLVAGAMSMAAGEYVSVASQRDVERADLRRETDELAASPDRLRTSPPPGRPTSVATSRDRSTSTCPMLLPAWNPNRGRKSPKRFRHEGVATDAKAINYAIQEAKAIELRLQNVSYDEIAKRLGFKGRGNAYNVVIRGLSLHCAWAACAACRIIWNPTRGTWTYIVTRSPAPPSTPTEPSP